MTQDTCKQMSTKDWLITIVVLIIPVVGLYKFEGSTGDSGRSNRL